MKRQVMIGALLMAIVVGGSGAVLAEHGPGGGCGVMPPGAEMGAGDFGGRLAKILKLTEVQQSKIKAILDEERGQAKPLFDQMHESKKLLKQSAETPTFDEANVRAIASEQAKIEIELIVLRMKVQNRINALLTAEQGEMAKNLRPDMDRQLPPPSDK